MMHPIPSKSMAVAKFAALSETPWAAYLLILALVENDPFPLYENDADE